MPWSPKPARLGPWSGRHPARLICLAKPQDKTSHVWTHKPHLKQNKTLHHTELDYGK